MAGFDKVSIETLFRIDGDCAFVTGGGGGLGRMSAIALAGAGANVAVSDIDGDAAERVAVEIREAGGIAQSFQLDVADRKRIDTVMGCGGRAVRWAAYPVE